MSVNHVRAQARRHAAAETRRRIRANLLAYLDRLRTSRDDDYGAGWNAAIEQVRAGVVEQPRQVLPL